MVRNYRPKENKLKCRAKSKRSQKQCNNWAITGATLCRMHNGHAEKKPALYNIKHGLSSPYVHQDKLPELLQRVDELKSPAGKEQALLIGAALTEQRLAAVPQDVEYIEKYVGARKSVRDDLKTAHEITQEEKPAAPTTFIVGNFDPQQAAPFQSRSVDGPCTVRYLDGSPFMLDVPTGAWVPCVKQVDSESKAEYFARLLEARSSD